MATITLTLYAMIDGKSQSISRAATIDDKIMPHFFDAYRDSYGQINGGTEEKPEMRDMTDAETFAAYAGGIASGSVANVQSFVRAAAMKAVEESMPTISVEAHS